jgi:triphosphoribosyl-dephospho-CoA synthetase
VATGTGILLNDVCKFNSYLREQSSSLGSTAD